MNIREILKDTHELEIIQAMDKIYENIEVQQSVWKQAAGFSCLDGCGDCCGHFEPDLLEGEALYLAAWMLENKPIVAKKILTGTYESANNPDGCILFEPLSEYHCTVYEGRCLICRLFGYSGEWDKNGKSRWKPCRFYPAAKLLPFEHRMYSGEEMTQRFGCEPPVMSTFMENALALTPDSNGQTLPLREALRSALQRLMFIVHVKGYNGDDDNNDNDTPTPISA